jgi:glutamate/tyrosine decarboxylase-like PLP-dependent enzyme
MRADALPQISGPAIICAQAGNVNTGSCDSIAQIALYAGKHDAWLHVDGAFGLWAAAAPDLRAQVAGIENADSWATDAHKWLNVPYDSGVAFVRNSRALQDTMSIHAAYLPGSPIRDPSDFTPELSRRARGVEIWAALRTLGRGGVAEMMSRSCRHARRFAEALHAAGFRILNEVVLNQVLVSFGDKEPNERIIAEIQQDGTCWCGGTVWQGKSAMRISVCCWSTSDQDVERSLEAIIRIANADTAN